MGGYAPDYLLVNEENISTINERLEKLYKLFSLDPYEEDLAIGDSEIVIAFPDESEYIAYSISDFLNYTEDIISIVKVNDSTVCKSK